LTIHTFTKKKNFSEKRFQTQVFGHVYIATNSFKSGYNLFFEYDTKINI